MNVCIFFIAVYVLHVLFVHKHAMGHNSACFFSEFSHEINEKTVLNFIKLLTARSLSLGNRCPTVGGKKADASATIHYSIQYSRSDSVRNCCCTLYDRQCTLSQK